MHILVAPIQPLRYNFVYDLACILKSSMQCSIRQAVPPCVYLRWWQWGHWALCLEIWNYATQAKNSRGGHFTATIIYFIDAANVLSQILQSKLSKQVLPDTRIVFINSSQRLYFHICSTISNFFSKASTCFQNSSSMPASLCEK